MQTQHRHANDPWACRSSFLNVSGTPSTPVGNELNPPSDDKRSFSRAVSSEVGNESAQVEEAVGDGTAPRDDADSTPTFTCSSPPKDTGLSSSVSVPPGFMAFGLEGTVDESSRRYSTTTTSDIRGTLEEQSWTVSSASVPSTLSTGLSASLFPAPCSPPPSSRRESDPFPQYFPTSLTTHRGSLPTHYPFGNSPRTVQKRPHPSVTSYPMSPTPSDAPSLSNNSSISTQSDSTLGELLPSGIPFHQGQELLSTPYDSPGSRFMRSAYFPPTSTGGSLAAELPSYEDSNALGISHGMMRSESLESPRTLLAEFSFSPGASSFGSGSRKTVPYSPRINATSPRVGQEGRFSISELQFPTQPLDEFDSLDEVEGGLKRRRLDEVADATAAMFDQRRQQGITTSQSAYPDFFYPPSLYHPLPDSISRSPLRHSLPPSATPPAISYAPYTTNYAQTIETTTYHHHHQQATFPRTPELPASTLSQSHSHRRPPRVREESYPTDNTELIHTPPPPSEFDNCSEEDMPRQQKLRFHEDHYTPLWVRRNGHAKEAWCALCENGGKWLQLKNSAYWYHTQFNHGVSSSGRYFSPPVSVRPHETGDRDEGLCGTCNEWVPYQTHKQSGQLKRPTLWWRHAHQCHQAVSPRKGGKKASSPVTPSILSY